MNASYEKGNIILVSPYYSSLFVRYGAAGVYIVC